MRKDPLLILKEFSRAQKESKISYERAARGLVDDHDREQSNGGGLIADAYNLESGHPELMDQRIHWSVRAQIAQQVSQSVYQKGVQKQSTSKSEPTISEGQTAENIQEMIKDPEKFGVTKEELLDVAWFISAGEESLDPEKIKDEVVARRSARPGIPGGETLTEEEETRAEREKRTLSHFEKLAESKKATNSDEHLLAIELNLAYLKANNDKLSEESRQQTLESISAQVATVGSMYATGDGPSLYRSGGDIAAGKIKNYALKKFGIPADAKGLAAKAATQVILNAAIPGVGAGLSKLVGPVLEKYIGKAIDAQVQAAKRAAKFAAATLAAIALTGFTSVAAGVGTAVLSAVIVVPVLLTLVIFIINAGGYIVPVSTTISEVGTIISLPPPSDGTDPTGPGAACPNANAPKPVATGVLYSADGKYAFPMAPANRTYYTCGHWDGTKASDMGINGITEKGWTGKGGIPVVAYTSGTITAISLNDSKGGKYIILAGNDGRYYYYAHNCALYVTPGQRVTVGEVMATTDNTGSAATSVEHVHFAISNVPNFIYNGTVCPSTDFQQKFGMNRCAASAQCPAL